MSDQAINRVSIEGNQCPYNTIPVYVYVYMGKR